MCKNGYHIDILIKASIPAYREMALKMKNFTKLLDLLRDSDPSCVLPKTGFIELIDEVKVDQAADGSLSQLLSRIIKVVTCSNSISRIPYTMIGKIYQNLDLIIYSFHKYDYIPFHRTLTILSYLPYNPKTDMFSKSDQILSWRPKLK